MIYALLCQKEYREAGDRAEAKRQGEVVGEAKAVGWGEGLR